MDYVNDLIFQIQFEIEYRIMEFKLNWLEYMFYIILLIGSVTLIWRHIDMCYIMSKCREIKEEEKELCYINERNDCWSEVNLVSSLIKNILG